MGKKPNFLHHKSNCGEQRNGEEEKTAKCIIQFYGSTYKHTGEAAAAQQEQPQQKHLQQRHQQTVTNNKSSASNEFHRLAFRHK